VSVAARLQLVVVWESAQDILQEGDGQASRPAILDVVEGLSDEWLLDPW